MQRETDPEGLYVTYPLVRAGREPRRPGPVPRGAAEPGARGAHPRGQGERAPAASGEVHFALGRALWGSGQERARALAMVERARDEFRANPPTPATQRELADIELWLASRADPGARPVVVTAAQ